MSLGMELWEVIALLHLPATTPPALARACLSHHNRLFPFWNHMPK